MRNVRLLVVLGVAAALVPMVASQGASAAPPTFMVTSAFCTGPGSITAAVEAANNNPGTDTIEFTPGLRVNVGETECDSARHIADVTESVIIDGNGAELVGHIVWITTGGINTPLLRCPKRPGSKDLMLSESPGFLTVNDRSNVSVEVNDLKLENLNDIAYFDSDQGSLVLEGVTASRILSHKTGCAAPAINFGGTGADLTIRSNDWNQIYNWGRTPGDNSGGEPVQTSQSIVGGVDAGDLTIEDSRFSEGGQHGFIMWPSPSTVNIVSTQMDRVGGITAGPFLKGPTTNIVNSVYSTGSDETGLVNRIINLSSGTFNIEASTIMVLTADCKTLCTQDEFDGVVRQWPGGGPVNLTQSAIGVNLSTVKINGSVIVNADATATGGFSADADTWIQPVYDQDAAALKTLTGQPALLTDPPGLPTLTEPSVALPTYVSPLLGTTAAPGQLIDKIPDSACGGANELINPIDGNCIDEDVFGNSRWDTGNEARNIGAVQLTLAPHLAVDATGDGTVDLGWNRPLDGSGDTVTGYVVRSRPAGSGGPFTELAVTGPDSSSVQVTGLTNGTLYEFEASAVRTTAGAGPASNLVTATPYGPVGAPTVTAQPENGNIRLFWTEPPAGGHPGPLYYTVVYRPVGATGWLAGPGYLSGRTTMIPGLPTDTTYEFSVYATAVDRVTGPLGTTTAAIPPPTTTTTTTTTVAPTTTGPTTTTTPLAPTTTMAAPTVPPSPTTSIAGGGPGGTLPATGPSGLDNTWIALAALAFVLSGSILLAVRRRPHRPVG